MSATLSWGKVLNTHGVRGELRIQPHCEQSMFGSVEQMNIGGTCYKLKSCRAHKNFVLVFFEGIDSIEAAMALKGREITVLRDKVALAPGQYFYSEIYGFSVFDKRVNRVVGTLSEVRENPANDLYIIECEGKSFMIPATPPFAVSVDFETRTVTVQTILGMLPDED